MSSTTTRLAFLAAAIVACATPVTAQVQTTVGGEIRPRYEIRDPSSPGGGTDEFTSMRVRLGLEALLQENLDVFVQFQDVRIWGEETHPLRDYQADNLDLHQGYLRYRGERLDWLTATVGRMQAAFGGQRLIGIVNWAQQGQSFDGVRADVSRDWGNLALVGYRIGDETAPSITVDHELYGAYGTVDGVGPGNLDLYWLYDRVEGAVRTDEHSVGARYVFRLADRLDGRVEATLQRGTRVDADVSAFMIGARLGQTFAQDRVGLTLWYDYLSGDDGSSASTEVFRTLFATNHKFYGFADLFTDIPTHTAGAGLQDLALKLSWRPTDALDVSVDLHSFRAAERGSLSGARFGEEIDLTASHRYSEFLTATAGVSYVVQNAPLAEVGRLSQDMKWLYLMLQAAF